MSEGWRGRGLVTLHSNSVASASRTAPQPAARLWRANDRLHIAAVRPHSNGGRPDPFDDTHRRDGPGFGTSKAHTERSPFIGGRLGSFTESFRTLSRPRSALHWREVGTPPRECREACGNAIRFLRDLQVALQHPERRAHRARSDKFTGRGTDLPPPPCSVPRPRLPPATSQASKARRTLSSPSPASRSARVPPPARSRSAPRTRPPARSPYGL